MNYYSFYKQMANGGSAKSNRKAKARRLSAAIQRARTNVVFNNRGRRI